MSARLRTLVSATILTSTLCTARRSGIIPRLRKHRSSMPNRRSSMFRRVLGAALIIGAVVLTAAPVTALSPGSCPSDSKLLNGGPTLVNGEGPGTW